MTHAPTNPVIHLELHTGDLPRACAFYSLLCGWCPERVDTGGERSYRALGLGGGIDGRIVECDTDRPTWPPYVEVAEITEAMQRARLLGASTLLDSREGPAGWRGVVAAPVGGEVALWQPKH